MVSFFLVKTYAEYKIIRKKKNILFLGHWCLRYRKNQIQNIGKKFANPYGISKKSKIQDYKESRKIEKKIFPVLIKILNEEHNINYTERQWKILLGHWLRRYINVIINRTKMLESVFHSHTISATYVDTKSFLPVPRDSYDAIWIFNDDNWNYILASKVLRLIKPKAKLIERKLDYVNNKNFHVKFNFNKYKNLIKLSLSNLFLWLGARNKFFLTYTYLPAFKELFLFIKFRQIPQFSFLFKPFLSKNKADSSLREKLAGKFNFKNQNLLLEVVSSTLFSSIPLTFLENFQELSNKSDKSLYPKSPLLIYTCNRFDTDDYFKFWVVKKITNGTKYIIGQHGNNYGTYRFDMHPTIEEETADNFITWGWSPSIKYKKGFISKVAGKKIEFKKNGKILFLQLCISQRLFTWDNYYEHYLYFNNQIRFVQNLNLKLRNRMTLRLHNIYKAHPWNDLSRWQDQELNINIDEGDQKFHRAIKYVNLVVHSYDSTAMLETLALNIPTIAFWSDGFNNLRVEAVPYYKELLKVGIIHFSPESAANLLNKIHDNIEEWWFKSEIQNARIYFCNKYANTTTRPLTDLKQTLLECL